MDPTLFDVSLWSAVGLCALGFLVRIGLWLARDLGPDASGASRWARFAGAFHALTGRRALGAANGLLVDGFLLRRLARADLVAWLAHAVLALGFTFLLVFHALGGLVTARLVEGFESTAAPWLFVRDLAGLLVVLASVVLFVRRRRRSPARRRSSVVLWTLLGVIFVSGFALQAAKTISAPVFYEMSEEYLGTSDPEDDDVAALSHHWATHYGVVFSSGLGEADEEVVDYGAELNEEACAECHASPRSALVSWPLSRAFVPMAGTIERHRVDRTLLLVHVFACLALLAWLPYGRLFHIITNPASTLASGATRGREPSPGLRAARRALALDACTQCGVCDAHCSVRGLVVGGEEGPLPSVKLRAARTTLGAEVPTPTLLQLAADHATCTDCHRCTDLCPAGIDLADLWESLRGKLTDRGYPEPARWVKSRSAAEWADRTIAAGRGEGEVAGRSCSVVSEASSSAAADRGLSSCRETFMPCVQCQTCTNVCPVVAHAPDGESAVDLTPQKVMNLLRLGLRDWAVGARMTWDCATCYQCQESCPEGIPVTEVLYELRELGWRRLRTLPPASPVVPGSTHDGEEETS